MTNGWKVCIHTGFYGMATYFSANYFTIYFMSLGVSSAHLGMVITLVNITNIAISVLFSQLTDRVSPKALKKGTIAFLLVMMLVLALYLPIRQLSPNHLSFTFPAYGLVAMVISALNALYTLYYYKMQYCVLEEQNYNQVSAASGVIGGIISLILSMTSTALFARYAFGAVLDGGLTAQVLFMAFSAVAVGAMHFRERTVVSAETQKQKTFGIKELFRLPSFYKLAVPNFLRGVASAIPAVCIIFAMTQCGFNESTATLIPTVTIIANLLSSVLYGLLTKRVEASKLLVFGAALMLVFPLVCMLGQLPFLVGYFVFYLGQNFVSYAVPYMVFRIIPYEIAGSYNTWRLLIQTLGTTVGTAILTGVADTVPLLPLIVAAILCQGVSSLVYASHYRKETEKQSCIT